MKYPDRPWNSMTRNESFKNAKKKRLEREIEELRKKHEKKQKDKK